MGKAFFTPLSIGAGFAAGMVATKVFEQVWGLIDEEEPPDAKHRRIDYRKLAMALAIQGAIMRVTRGFVDHGLRQGYARLTGSWPGEEAPEPE
ncbi:MAG: DUF4235 domain-containing protein [Actinomycetota bacterium]|nr:DUF4235 domain-containing protein [Actinomycetota bacterium]